MKRCAAFGIVLLSIWTLPILGWAAELVEFSDDFDMDAPGVLPAGWEIVWSGAGEGFQAVSDTRSFSTPNSFHVLGQPGWSAVVQRTFSLDDPIIGYEFKILIDSYGLSGEEHPAFFAYQAEGNQWGTYYGAIRFDHASGAVLSEDGTVLSYWSPQTWYTVRVLLDRSAKTYDVWIDGATVGSGLALNAQEPELVEALALVSAHAGVSVYYDDVSVFVPEADSDGDGVPDAADPCPFVNPGLIDIDANGCVDDNLVIAGYITNEVGPIAYELPDAAMTCVDAAVLDLELEIYETALTDMLCAVEVLDAEGTPLAAAAEHTVGLSAQTTALLAIELTAQVVGADDPNVISATTLANIGIERLAVLETPEATTLFVDAVTQLDAAPQPAIRVEVKRRNSSPWIWEKHTYTYAAWWEEVISPIRVTNVGNVDLTKVRVNQTWSRYRANVGDLAVGEWKYLNMGVIGREMFGYEVKMNDPDPFSMLTSAYGKYEDQWVSDGASCTVDIIHPAIDVVITAPDSAKPGELISVSVTVTNTGDVVLRDVWYFFNEGILDHVVIGDMAPGASESFFYHYLVPDDAHGKIWLKARAMGGRDFDYGLSWTFFGRRISDWEWHKLKIKKQKGKD
jgi:hypothetical protein